MGLPTRCGLTAAVESWCRDQALVGSWHHGALGSRMRHRLRMYSRVATAPGAEHAGVMHTNAQCAYCCLLLLTAAARRMVSIVG